MQPTTSSTLAPQASQSSTSTIFFSLGSLGRIGGWFLKFRAACIKAIANAHAPTAIINERPNTNPIAFPPFTSVFATSSCRCSRCFLNLLLPCKSTVNKPYCFAKALLTVYNNPQRSAICNSERELHILPDVDWTSLPFGLRWPLRQFACFRFFPAI